MPVPPTQPNRHRSVSVFTLACAAIQIVCQFFDYRAAGITVPYVFKNRFANRHSHVVIAGIRLDKVGKCSWQDSDRHLQSSQIAAESRKDRLHFVIRKILSSAIDSCAIRSLLTARD